MNSIKSDICDRIDQSVINLNRSVSSHGEHITSKLCSVNAGMKEDLRAVGSQMERSMTSELVEIQNNQNSIKLKLDSLEDALSTKSMSTLRRRKF